MEQPAIPLPSFPLPSITEQDEICEFLDTKLTDVKRIASGIESQIATLTAYRKSLIHECVTGQRRGSDADVAPTQQIWNIPPRGRRS